MNWIKKLKLSRYTTLFLFAILFLSMKFNLIDDYLLFKNVYLYDLTSILVLFYLVIYLKESRLEIIKRDEEISALKSQLK